MKTPSLLLLAALMAVSTAAPAKGAKFRGGGSHHDTSHTSTSHSEPSGSSLHLPRARGQSASEPQSGDAAAQAGGTHGTADQRAAMTDRLNAELAAQRAATPPGAPVGKLVAKTPVAEVAPLAANEQRLTKPVTVGKVAAISSTNSADLTTLAPKDSARSQVDEVRSNDRYNARGVNCSIYPARC